jgi:hypothetical protein
MIEVLNILAIVVAIWISSLISTLLLFPVVLVLSMKMKSNLIIEVYIFVLECLTLEKFRKRFKK